MLWGRCSTSCSFYSLTFPAMRIAGVAQHPLQDCVLWLQAAVCGLVLSSAGGGKWPKGAFSNSSGNQKTALTPLQKSLGDIRHQCLWWSLSGFAQHVSAIYLPLANVLQRDVLSLRKALLRSRLERPAAWRWTFLGTEMGIQQTSETQRTIVHCTTTNPSPSSRFLVSLGFLASLQPQLAIRPISQE